MITITCPGCKAGIVFVCTDDGQYGSEFCLSCDECLWSVRGFKTSKDAEKEMAELENK